MWFSTINGLQRFDGGRLMTFKSIPDNPTTIPTNYLRGMFLDASKRIWLLGNNNQVGIFSTERFAFKEYTIQTNNKVRSYIFKHFLNSHDGKLLLYEENGSLYRLDEKTEAFIPAPDLIPIPKGWPRKRITWDAYENKYWITSDSGLAVFNPATRALSYRGNNAENHPVIRAYEKLRQVINVVVDKDHIYFYASPTINAFPLLHSFNRKTGKAIVQDPANSLKVNYYEIHGLLQQKNGNLWAHGVYMFAQWRPDEGAFYPVPNSYKGEQSIKFNYANFSYEDRESNIWIATDNGLFRFNPAAQVFHSYSLIHAEEKNITERGVLSMSMLQTKDEHVFIGTWGLGTFYFDKYFNPLPLPAPLKAIEKNVTNWDIFQHKASGKIWFTVQGGKGAVLVYDPQKQTTEWITDRLFEKDGIRDITEDKWGNLWMGTLEGQLIKWDYVEAKGDIKKGFRHMAAIGYARKMYTDWSGYIWAVTNNNGLHKIDPATNKIIKHYTEEAPKGYGLTSNELCDILQHNDSTIIVAAGSINLINLKTNAIRHITTADGLPSNTAVSVLKDEKGILWFGMTSGLCRVNLEKNIYIPYDRRDGIPYDNFEPTRALKLLDGRLIFGTDQNLLAFDPKRAVNSDKPFPPTPTLTSFRLMDQSLLVDSLMKAGKVTLPYNRTSINIEFSNLSFLLQKKTHYYYKLENLDAEWIKADEGSHADYNYIPPGNYTFKVKSQNEDGISSNGFASIDIEVKPPFWQTGFFYALLSLLVIGILYLIDKERIKRLRSVQQVRTQIAGDLHTDIQTTLNDINVLSAMARIKADKDIVRSKEYIEQISDKSSTMMESMDDILWSIDPQNDSMQKMLLRIQEFTDGLRKTHGIQITLNNYATLKDLSLDMRSRHEFLLFYKNALNFAVLQTGCSTITVTLELKKQRLLFKLLADCISNPVENILTKQQKEEMQKRSDALNAALDITYDRRTVEVVMQLPT